MFKLDQKEFIKFRVDFQKRLTWLADEIVTDAVGEHDSLNPMCEDKEDFFDSVFDRVTEECVRECIYTSDNHNLVQFFQTWDFEEVDEAEQRFQEYGHVFTGLDDLMGTLAYILWENHLTAAVQLRIDDLFASLEEDAA